MCKCATVVLTSTTLLYFRGYAIRLLLTTVIVNVMLRCTKLKSGEINGRDTKMTIRPLSIEVGLVATVTTITSIIILAVFCQSVF